MLTQKVLSQYLSSGYIDEGELVSKILKREVDKYGKHYHSPLWVLLTSIITSNYETHFSRIGIGCQSDGIMNIYCNGTQPFSRYSIRIHILNFLLRNRVTTLSQLEQKYESLFEEIPTGFDDAFKYAIKRLLDCDLIESPEYYRVNRLEDVRGVKYLEITQTGKYYILELANYFEYLTYMKDDVELGDNPYRVKDCIKIKLLEDRYHEVYKFLKTIYEEEEDFLFRLSGSKRKLFQMHFSSSLDSSPFVINQSVNSMIEFGEDRGLDTRDFEGLLSEVTINSNAFNEL